ncbi:MAG: LTA synthase family protein, partial [Firmicutes bacterium]|nr:LTA synthase family protein [Bacillota bacterium]
MDRTRLKTVITLLLLPLTLVWGEFFLARAVGFSDGAFLAAGAVLTALAFGLVLTALIALFRSDRLRGWLLFLLAELVTLFFTIEYYCNDGFTAYMSPASMFTGAGGIATEYGDVLARIVTSGFGTILLFHVPALIALVWAILKQARLPRSVVFFAGLFIASALFADSAVSLQNRDEIASEKYTYGYSFDDSVRSFGLLTATRLSFQYGAFGTPEPPGDEPPVPVAEPDPEPSPADTDPSDPTVPYRGLFAGKNLVLITAESFSKELLNYPELYPTLARMAENGIRVTDYYHPFWGGSTTSGEAAILLGLIPTEGADSMQRIIGKDNSRTIANALAPLGYSLVAYHNGTTDYYNRIETHPALGYDAFIAKGNGMERYVSDDWPGSDAEMFAFTTEDLLETAFLAGEPGGSYTPFHAYFMTYSGHGIYSLNSHDIAIRHKDAVSGYDLPHRIRAYLAANIDLEEGLAYMVRRFAEEGILDDTVFVITTDHYPYALQYGETWGNDEDWLAQLYGYPADSLVRRDHNALIIWSPCLEELEEPITVDGPSYAPDILPTLLSLFGIDYDPAEYVGRDLLSTDGEALAIWVNGSWKSDLGFYNATTGR